MSEAPVKRKPGRPRKVTNVEPVAGEGREEAERQGALPGHYEYVSEAHTRLDDGPKGSVGSLHQSLQSGSCEPNNRHELSRTVKASELAAIHREAWEAFDYDAPRGKTDSTGRIWAFDPDIKGGVKRVSLSVRRVNGDRQEYVIECPSVGYQSFRGEVEACVDLLNEALK